MTAAEFLDLVKSLWAIVGPLIGMAFGAYYQRKLAIEDRDYNAKQSEKANKRDKTEAHYEEAKKAITEFSSNSRICVTRAIRQQHDVSLDGADVLTRLLSILKFVTIDEVSSAASTLFKATFLYCQQLSAESQSDEKINATETAYADALANFHHVGKAFLTVLRKEL